MSEINVERVLQLEQEFHTARETTITQLLALQKETAEQLRALGHDGKPSKVTRKKKPCSKCQSTEHDARFHRGDGKPAAKGHAAVTKPSGD